MGGAGSKCGFEGEEDGERKVWKSVEGLGLVFIVVASIVNEFFRALKGRWVW